MKEIKTTLADITCSSCGEMMKFSGLVLESIPPQYPFHCQNCGNGAILMEDDVTFVSTEVDVVKPVTAHIYSHGDRSVGINGINHRIDDLPVDKTDPDSIAFVREKLIECFSAIYDEKCFVIFSFEDDSDI